MLQELRKIDKELSRESSSSIYIYPQTCEVFPVEIDSELFESEEVTNMLVPCDQTETVKQMLEFDKILAMGFSTYNAHPNFDNSSPEITKETIQKTPNSVFQADLDMNAINSIFEENYF